MADEKEVKEKEVKGEKKLKVSKPSVDFPVDVIATEADPYHETGAKFQAGSKKAAELVKRGWVKMAKEVAALILLLLLIAPAVDAQTSVLADLKNSLSPYATSDTVTNTGTAVLTSARVNGPAQNVTVQIVCTEISGTTAGTITLQGSLNGTNFVALTDSTTVPNITTKTATDVASQTFAWVLTGSPYLYYRVSWTGSGTMAATVAGKILKH